jgi:CheY-like chemotaxis protein
MSIKVLVVDDSLTYRRILTDVLRSLPDVEVVGSAANGSHVASKVKDLQPDLITLDIELPGMNGIEVMDALRRANMDVKVLVISGVTFSGGRLTLQALQNGAFDFITKPCESTPEENLRCLRARNWLPGCAPSPTVSKCNVSCVPGLCPVVPSRGERRQRREFSNRHPPSCCPAASRRW